jgi:hypothetical protein
MTKNMNDLIIKIARGVDVNTYAQLSAIISKREGAVAARTIVALYKAKMLQVASSGGLEISEAGRAYAAKRAKIDALALERRALEERALEALHGVAIEHDAYPTLVGAYYSDGTMSWWGVPRGELQLLGEMLALARAGNHAAMLSGKRLAEVIANWEESSRTGASTRLTIEDRRVLGLRGRPR